MRFPHPAEGLEPRGLSGATLCSCCERLNNFKKLSLRTAPNSTEKKPVFKIKPSRPHPTVLLLTVT